MNYIFNFPDIGEGLDEGTIVEWIVQKGQEVKMGDHLVVMETDKVVTEIPSPRSGIIKKIYGGKGDTIHVGDALVEIETEASAATEQNAETKVSSSTNTEDKSASKKENIEEAAGVVGTLEVASSSDVLSASSEGYDEKNIKEKNDSIRALATPVARAMAKDLGLDINLIKGTGPASRVMKEDILAYSNSNKSPALKKYKAESKAMDLDDNSTEIKALSQIRKTIAKNMTRSKHNAAHMSVFDDLEISELNRIRTKYKDIYATEGIKLTYLAFVVKACAMALKEIKAMNAEMDLEKDIMIYKNYINIGIAVNTPKGLMVPVIKHADKKNIKELAIEIDTLANKARDGKLELNDYKDGTFTITSFGSIGGKFATPIINYPQVGILGIGRISKEPIVKGDELAIGLMLPLSLSADHRIVDGAEVSSFLNLIMEYLAEPVSLIMH